MMQRPQTQWLRQWASPQRLRRLWPFAPRGGAIIRDACDSDLETLSEMHCASFENGWSADDLAGLARGAKHLLLLAEKARPISTKRVPAGFALVRIGADEAELLTLVVAQHSRRCGIGRKLMETVLHRLYNLDVRHLYLEVDICNEAAMALYRSLAFEQAGVRKNYYGKYGQPSDAAILKRDISQ